MSIGKAKNNNSSNGCFSNFILPNIATSMIGTTFSELITVLLFIHLNYNRFMSNSDLIIIHFNFFCWSLLITDSPFIPVEVYEYGQQLLYFWFSNLLKLAQKAFGGEVKKHILFFESSQNDTSKANIENLREVAKEFKGKVYHRF